MATKAQKEVAQEQADQREGEAQERRDDAAAAKKKAADPDAGTVLRHNLDNRSHETVSVATGEIVQTDSHKKS